MQSCRGVGRSLMRCRGLVGPWRGGDGSSIVSARLVEGAPTHRHACSKARADNLLFVEVLSSTFRIFGDEASLLDSPEDVL
jgi:hypothetical protein